MIVVQVDQLLETLVSELDLGAVPQKDKNGEYQLKIHENAQVSITELEPGIFFTTKIMPIPDSSNKEALFIYLMKANLLGQGTGGGAIGIDPSEKFLTLTLSLPEETNYTRFKEGLEDLLNYLDYWREEVVRFLATIMD